MAIYCRRPTSLSLVPSNTAQNNVCLVLQGEHSLDCQLHVIDPSNHHHMTITKRLDPPFKSSMPNFDIAGSCNGFLRLFDDSQLVPDTIFIYNPFTNEFKQLPPTNKNFSNQRVVLGFGFDPISKEYKVIRIVYCIPPIVSWYIRYETSKISINTLGKDSWRSLGQAAYWLDGGTPSNK
ncbi:hypothetical protein Syun_029788 [Stephania yunnanensis]|uniref:F-box associated beta-propeller type 3 domain-containing protein n=1 Tax=Stephania yunnanensis TaxID=152371 RepID=A0AAP0E682_9MAGN